MHSKIPQEACCNCNTIAVTVPGWGDCPWGGVGWGGWGAGGVEVATLFLAFTPGDEFWVVLAAAVPNAPVLTGLCRADDCLVFRLCTSPSFGLLNSKQKVHFQIWAVTSLATWWAVSWRLINMLRANWIQLTKLSCLSVFSLSPH